MGRAVAARARREKCGLSASPPQEDLIDSVLPCRRSNLMPPVIWRHSAHHFLCMAGCLSLSLFVVVFFFLVYVLGLG